MAQHLLRCWPEVAARIRSARRLLVLLDFDGTLASLRAAPDAVMLSAGTRQAIDRLARHRRVRTIIVSGRRRDDLIRRVCLPHVQYWGLFGWERRRGRSLPPAVHRVVSAARTEFASSLEGLRGVWIEDKGLGFSIHYRSAPEEVRCQARPRVRRLLGRYRADLHLAPGAMVWNVLPHQVPGKGPSVLQVLSRLQTGALPVYVGDDATDEPAFGVLKRAITVRVGPAGRTRARYRLDGPGEVRALLELLDMELSHGTQ